MGSSVAIVNAPEFFRNRPTKVSTGLEAPRYYTKFCRSITYVGKRKIISVTRIHSSRMRTVRWSSCLGEGGCLTRGVYLPRGVSASGWVSTFGVSAKGGLCLGCVCLPGGLSARGGGCLSRESARGCLPRGCLPRGCLPGGDVILAVGIQP